MSNRNTCVKKPIRNTRAFLKSYLSSKTGYGVLNKRPIRLGKGKTAVIKWQNPSIAQAFKESL